MTLVEQASQLEVGLQDLRTKRQAAHRDGWFRTRATDLRTVREVMEGPCEYFEAVAKLEAPAPIDRSLSVRLSEVRDATSFVADLARKDPGALSSDNVVQKLHQTLNRLANDLRSAASNHWRLLAPRLTPAVGPDLLSALDQISSYRPTVAQLRSYHQEFSSLSGQAWPTRDDLAKLVKVKADSDRLWDTLAGGEGIPNTVLDFLAACARDGAQLATVTPEIREWITSRGLEASFVVRLAGG